MKKILIQFPGLGQGKLFNETARDGVLEPFIHLRKKLKDLDYEFTTADDHSVEDCAGVWFWDLYDIVTSRRSNLQRICDVFKKILNGRRQVIHQRDLYGECIRAGLKNKMVLFIGEPPAVLPYNWDVKLHKDFSVIFTWNDDYVDGKKYHKFCWPLAGSFPEVSYIPFSKRKLLVNISGNKVSNHPRELYSARRNTIRFFEQTHPDQFDLYGIGWDQATPIYTSYRGVVDHKWEVYPNYRFGVCYENMFGEPGWITEKIFDCMRAGCVPIYWGAPNITQFVDQETFIDRQRFQSEDDLAKFLLSVTDLEYKRYREAIEHYLQSDRFAAFLPHAFTDNIVKVLSLQRKA